MSLDLEGYKGNVKKTSKVFTNDPKTPQGSLVLQGKVRTLIDVHPEPAVAFQGRADKLEERPVELVAVSQPFHVQKMESNLDENIRYRLETLEDGKKYRLWVSNTLKRGEYSGVVKVFTDLAQKREVNIRVKGSIDGEIRVNPKALVLGKLGARQPVRVGKVQVASTRSKSFQITKLTYDERYIQVVRQPLSREAEFNLVVTPRLENVPPGTRQQTSLAIETDEFPEERNEIPIQVFNLSETPNSPPTQKP